MLIAILGVDTGWMMGLCLVQLLNIWHLELVKCRVYLIHWLLNSGRGIMLPIETINYVSRIENETGLVFTQGQKVNLAI